jgi:hypothetical protein
LEVLYFKTSLNFRQRFKSLFFKEKLFFFGSKAFWREELLYFYLSKNSGHFQLKKSKYLKDGMLFSLDFLNASYFKGWYFSVKEKTKVFKHFGSFFVSRQKKLSATGTVKKGLCFCCCLKKL